MPNPLWLLTVLAILLAGEDRTHGTAIAIVRTKDSIAIAADSRAVSGTGEKKPDDCKIRSAGGSFFTLHGIGDRDVIERIAQTLSGRASISARLREIRDELSLIMPLRMRGMANLHSSGVFVFTISNGVPYLGYVRFTAASSEIFECPPDCDPGGIRTPSVSPYGDLISPDARTIEDLRAFVQGQIEKGRMEEMQTSRAASVGPPIQSMILRRDGHHEWRDKPDVCKDQP